MNEMNVKVDIWLISQHSLISSI